MTQFQAIQKLVTQTANGMLKFLDARLKTLGERIEKSQKAPIQIDTSNIESRMTAQNKILSSILSITAKRADKPVNVKGNIEVNTKPLERIVKTAGDQQLTAAKKTQEVVKGVQSVAELLLDQSKLDQVLVFMASIGTQLKELIAATKNQTFKLDPGQLRELAGSARAGGGGGGGMGAGKLTGLSATVTNVALTTADTEYSHTFSKGCVGFTVKLRSQNTLLLYAWVTGKLPTSGDGAAYMTAPQNFLRSPEWLEPAGKTIYLQTGSATQVAEIEEIIT